jgi:sugar lactone lactonase YvrE
MSGHEGRELSTTSVLVDDLKLPECLRWRDNRLFFSDMEAGTIVVVDAEGAAEVVATLAPTPAGLGWTPDGDLLAVSRHDRQLVRVVDGEPEPVADLGEASSGDLNDMVVDSLGRAYIGNFGYDYLGGADAEPAEVVMVDVDGAVSVAAEGLEFPNGLVITDDGRRMLVAETFACRITELSIAADGSLGEPRVFADLGGRQPDGLCLDAEGALWVGCPMQHEVCRVLSGGEITDTVVIPGRHCMSAMLGGADGRTLFIGTADSDFDPMHPERGASRPSQGRIESVEVEVPHGGLP